MCLINITKIPYAMFVGTSTAIHDCFSANQRWAVNAAMKKTLLCIPGKKLNELKQVHDLSRANIHSLPLNPWAFPARDGFSDTVSDLAVVQGEKAFSECSWLPGIYLNL